MKIAITDACIFIDLYDLQLTHHFFGLDLEVHTSLNVFNELNPSQKEVLKAFQPLQKLTLHNISSADRIAILNEAYPKSLSDTDKTVLFLAKKIGAIVSSDKTVRHNAKIRSIEYHGMIWIFDKLLEASLITYKEAAEKLKMLINTNMIYQNNAELLTEMANRLKKWEKLF